MDLKQKIHDSCKFVYYQWYDSLINYLINYQCTLIGYGDTSLTISQIKDIIQLSDILSFEDIIVQLGLDLQYIEMPTLKDGIFYRYNSLDDSVYEVIEIPGMYTFSNEYVEGTFVHIEFINYYNNLVKNLFYDENFKLRVLVKHCLEVINYDNSMSRMSRLLKMIKGFGGLEWSN